MDDPLLRNAVREALLQLETDGHIVIVSTTLGPVVDAVANKVADVVPNTELSLRELYATRQLIYQAIQDNRFFPALLRDGISSNAPRFSEGTLILTHSSFCSGTSVRRSKRSIIEITEMPLRLTHR